MSILNDIYGGDWLKPDDLGNHQQVRVHISGWFVDEKEDRRNPGQMQRQIVLHLHKTDKKFGLNKTNAEAIAAWYGPHPDNWVNQPITIRQEWALAFGEQKLVLRVNPPRPGEGYQAAAQQGYPPQQQQPNQGLGFQQGAPAGPPPMNAGQQPGTVPPPAGYDGTPQQAPGPDWEPAPSPAGLPPQQSGNQQPAPQQSNGVQLPGDDLDDEDDDIPF